MIHLIPLLSFVAVGIQASPLRHATRADGVISSAILDGVTYSNKVSYFSYVHDCTCMLSALFKGLVGFGFIPAAFQDSTGDTMGAIGSSMAIERGSWKKEDGKFTGVLVAHPDRGYNMFVPPFVTLFIRSSFAHDQ